MTTTNPGSSASSVPHGVSTQVSIKPFTSGDDPSNNWKKWQRKFEYFALSTDLSKHSTAKSRAILLQNVGDEALDVYLSLGLQETDTSPTYTDMLKHLGDYFALKTNVTVKRYEFFSQWRKSLCNLGGGTHLSPKMRFLN